MLRGIRFLALLVFLLSLGSGSVTAETPTHSEAPATTITVTTGQDFNTSKSEKCTGKPVSECSLRRAIVEARLSAKPVLIQFDIPNTDPSHNSSLNTWVLEIQKSPSDPYTFRRLTGQITIDGSTQPNGRTLGPSIFLRSTDSQKDGLVVGDIAGDDQIVIRGLGFQNFRTHLLVNTDNNLIENNWFGLTENGQGVFLRNNRLDDGSGSAGIALAGGTTGAENNIIRNNLFLGFDGTAAAIRGNANTFSNNRIGLRADGSIPAIPLNQRCTNGSWLGGGGVSVEGGTASASNAHIVTGNTFAGLRQEIFAKSTQPDAIRVSGDYYTIHNNQIGVDATGKKQFVCGRGIYLGGTNDPNNCIVSDNRIINPGLSGISINGALTDANTLTRNVIVQDQTWVTNSDKVEPETAIEMGKTVPDSLQFFQPARVTRIDGKQVSGLAGAGSPCPFCYVELFLDDVDNVVEAKQFLARTQADGKGRWSLTMPQVLANDEGLRTTTTTVQFNTIAGMNAGTTTKLSDGKSGLYRPMKMIYLPTCTRGG